LEFWKVIDTTLDPKPETQDPRTSTPSPKKLETLPKNLDPKVNLRNKKRVVKENPEGWATRGLRRST